MQRLDPDSGQLQCSVVADAASLSGQEAIVHEPCQEGHAWRNGPENHHGGTAPGS
jgi:hypothetical protein